MNKAKEVTTKDLLQEGSPPTSKRYNEAFKQQAVELWLRSTRSGTQIARELGISYPILKEWKRRYQGTALPQGNDLAAENRALRAELIRVRERCEILKKTLGIFSEPPPSDINGSTK
jgi:transposase